MYGNQHTSKSISSKKRIKSNIKAENKNSGYKKCNFYNVKIDEKNKR